MPSFNNFTVLRDGATVAYADGNTAPHRRRLVEMVISREVCCFEVDVATAAAEARRLVANFADARLAVIGVVADAQGRGPEAFAAAHGMLAAASAAVIADIATLPDLLDHVIAIAKVHLRIVLVETTAICAPTWSIAATSAGVAAIYSVGALPADALATYGHAMRGGPGASV